ncbi:hypothetical protein JTY60_00025 [symbiont of Argiope bruennichi]|uniref:hypothetical protein n=1 Tax=symbiont of Argiope bruennichi TaxID=2810479 RepID=UPI003DA3B7FD
MGAGYCQGWIKLSFSVNENNELQLLAQGHTRAGWCPEVWSKTHIELTIKKTCLNLFE